MGSRDLRKGRVSEAGRVYLITATTAQRRPLFADFTHARLLISELRRLERSNLAHSMAWVVMPDHFHWLMRLNGPMPLSSVVKALKGRTARRLGPLLENGGEVWQPGFHDRALRREDELLPIARYVVANPLRAGLVRRIGCEGVAVLRTASRMNSLPRCIVLFCGSEFIRDCPSAGFLER